jgi:hypothetical protein
VLPQRAKPLCCCRIIPLFRACDAAIRRIRSRTTGVALSHVACPAARPQPQTDPSLVTAASAAACPRSRICRSPSRPSPPPPHLCHRICRLSLHRPSLFPAASGRLTCPPPSLFACYAVSCKSAACPHRHNTAWLEGDKPQHRRKSHNTAWLEGDKRRATTWVC